MKKLNELNAKDVLMIQEIMQRYTEELYYGTDGVDPDNYKKVALDVINEVVNKQPRMEHIIDRGLWQLVVRESTFENRTYWTKLDYAKKTVFVEIYENKKLVDDFEFLSYYSSESAKHDFTVLRKFLNVTKAKEI